MWRGEGECLGAAHSPPQCHGILWMLLLFYSCELALACNLLPPREDGRQKGAPRRARRIWLSRAAAGVLGPARGQGLRAFGLGAALR